MPSVNLCRQNLWFTKYKENELRASSIYNGIDLTDPVVDFDTFSTDEALDEVGHFHQCTSSKLQLCLQFLRGFSGDSAQSNLERMNGRCHKSEFSPILLTR